MTDIDQMLRAELRARADSAPRTAELLESVHGRSRALRRRRQRATWAGAAAALAALVLPAAVVGAGVGGSRPDGDPAVPSAPAGVVGPATPGPGVSTPQPSVSGSAADRSDSIPVTMAAAQVSGGVFPLQLGASHLPAFDAPIVTLRGGALESFYLAKDPEGGADITLVVTGVRPTFDPAPAPVTETGQRVRGVAGTLRTVQSRPTAQYTLFWQDAPTRWVQLRTDDTFEPAQVVAFADALASAALPVVEPFRFDLAPAGAVLDTVTPSAVAFRLAASGGSATRGPAASTAPGSAVVTCTLFSSRSPRGSRVTVGSDPAYLERGASGVVLTITRADAQMSLVVEVPTPYMIADADLIRFAAGIHLTDRAEPAS